MFFKPRKFHRKGIAFTGVSLVLMMAVLTTESCKHEPPIGPMDPTDDSGGGGTPWVPPPDTGGVVVVCDPDTVYFEQAVLPLLVSFCATQGCHDAITHEEGVRLYDYAHIHQQVNPGHPNSSDIIQSIQETGNDHMPPSDHAQLTAEQIALISTWITQGALNNSCEPSACDTTNVTYSGMVAPMIANMCTGCHSGSSPDGNIDLTTYSGVHAVAVLGTLSGAIQHQYGYSSMPPSGSGLSDCHIQQMLIWIQQGSPNN